MGLIELLHLAAGAALAMAGWLIPRHIAGSRRAAFAALLLDAAPFALGAGLLALATGRPLFAGVIVLALDAEWRALCRRPDARAVCDATGPPGHCARRAARPPTGLGAGAGRAETDPLAPRARAADHPRAVRVLLRRPAPGALDPPRPAARF